MKELAVRHKGAPSGSGGTLGDHFSNVAERYKKIMNEAEEAMRFKVKDGGENIKVIKKDVYKKGETVHYQIETNVGLGDKAGVEKLKVTSGTIKERKRKPGGGYEYILSNGLTVYGSEILGSHQDQ